MKKIKLGFCAIVLMSSTVTSAGECKIKIAREACSGKETEAFKPYDGKKETDEKKTVGDAAACSAMADKSSKIVRKGTLASKSVTGTFDGVDLGKSFTDQKPCK